MFFLYFLFLHSVSFMFLISRNFSFSPIVVSPLLCSPSFPFQWLFFPSAFLSFLYSFSIFLLSTYIIILFPLYTIPFFCIVFPYSPFPFFSPTFLYFLFLPFSFLFLDYFLWISFFQVHFSIYLYSWQELTNYRPFLNLLSGLPFPFPY